MRKPYFPNLEAEIAKHGISKKTIAESLNIKQKTLSEKFAGRLKFSLAEGLYLHSLFPNVPIESLFERGEE